MEITDLTPLTRKEATKTCMQHFVVTGDHKNRHLRVGVAAIDIDRAIALVRKKYLGCKIYSVQHQGPIEITETE